MRTRDTDGAKGRSAQIAAYTRDTPSPCDLLCLRRYYVGKPVLRLVGGYTAVWLYDTPSVCTPPETLYSFQNPRPFIAFERALTALCHRKTTRTVLSVYNPDGAWKRTGTAVQGSSVYMRSDAARYLVHTSTMPQTKPRVQRNSLQILLSCVVNYSSVCVSTIRSLLLTASLRVCQSERVRRESALCEVFSRPPVQREGGYLVSWRTPLQGRLARRWVFPSSL